MPLRRVHRGSSYGLGLSTRRCLRWLPNVRIRIYFDDFVLKVMTTSQDTTPNFLEVFHVTLQSSSLVLPEIFLLLLLFVGLGGFRTLE